MEIIIRYVYLIVIILYALLALLHYFNIIYLIKSIRNFTAKKNVKNIITTLLRIDLLKNFWRVQGKFLKILYAVLAVYIIVTLVIAGYVVAVEKNGVYFNGNILSFTLIFPLMVIIIIYYPVIFGWNLLSKVIDTIINVRYKKDAQDAMLNFIIPLFFTFYLISPIVFESKLIFVILFFITLVGHFVTLKALFVTSHNAKYLQLANVKDPTVSKYIVSIIWLVILLLNLYCETLLINKIIPNSYTENSSLDLFFMILSSFFTIDIGDMPKNWISKFGNLIVVISSVYFFVIILASIVSKDFSKTKEAQNRKFIKRRLIRSTLLKRG